MAKFVTRARTPLASLLAGPRHLCFVRIFGIGATAADVVAVLRRGPSGWCHVGRWDIAARRYEPGSWLHGTVYPQRCDLSPDGRYLCYFALKGDSTWDLGPPISPSPGCPG